MKKMTALMLTLLLLCAPALAIAESETDLPTESVLEDEFAFADEESEWLYEEDETDEDELTDEELLALLGEDDGEPITQINESDQDDLLGAMEVYSWFALQPLDYDEDFPSPDGTMWRVLDERFNTPDLMENMLSFYFTDEIVDELWNSSANPYVEIDGFLYTNGEGREIDQNIGETTIEVTASDDDRIELTATVEYIEPINDMQSESFIYERRRVGDDWKYTQFPFFW